MFLHNFFFTILCIWEFKYIQAKGENQLSKFLVLSQIY